MPNNDDASTDLLQTPKRQSGSPESAPDPDRRSSGVALLLALIAFVIPSGILLLALMNRPGAVPIISMVAYTLLIPYVASDGFLNQVPWDRLTRGRFLLQHCLALAIVYLITTGALAAKPHLPTFFTLVSRRGSFFDWSLVGILVLLAHWECSWVSRNEK